MSYRPWCRERGKLHTTYRVRSHVIREGVCPKCGREIDHSPRQGIPRHRIGDLLYIRALERVAADHAAAMHFHPHSLVRRHAEDLTT